MESGNRPAAADKPPLSIIPRPFTPTAATTPTTKATIPPAARNTIAERTTNRRTIRSRRRSMTTPHGRAVRHRLASRGWHGYVGLFGHRSSYTASASDETGGGSETDSGSQNSMYNSSIKLSLVDGSWKQTSGTGMTADGSTSQDSYSGSGQLQQRLPVFRFVQRKRF